MWAREFAENLVAWLNAPAPARPARIERKVRDLLPASPESAGPTGAAEQYQLGERYKSGNGVPKDQAEAVRLFCRSAEQGYPHAQVAIGIMYQNGEVLPKDHAKALKWYLEAANQGDLMGQFGAGLIYSWGTHGAPKDKVAAYMWFNLAAAKGLEPAVEKRDSLAEEMALPEIAKAQRLSREFKPSRR